MKILFYLVLSVFCSPLYSQRVATFEGMLQDIRKFQIQNEQALDEMSSPKFRQDFKKLHSHSILDILQNSGLKDFKKPLYTNVSQRCWNQTIAVFAHLFSGGTGSITNNWVIPMIDASGKIPPGILEGGIAWMGSFTECNNITATLTPEIDGYYDSFTGRYCNVIQDFKLGNFSISQFSLDMDPNGHRGLRLGICVPSGCDRSDIYGLLETVYYFLYQSNVTSESFDPYVFCQYSREESRPWTSGAVAAMLVAALILSLVFVGTVYDIILQHVIQKKSEYKTLTSPVQAQNGLIGSTGYGSTGDQVHESGNTKLRVDEYAPLIGNQFESKNGCNPNPGICGRLLLAFSFYTNASKCLSTRQNAGALTSVNGIRFLSMSWVILGHALFFGVATFANPIQYILLNFKNFSFQALLGASVSVDSFFVLSGLLVCYLTMKEMAKRNGLGVKGWALFYFHRYWRLTPPYMLILLVYSSTFLHWGSGPNWPEHGEEEMCGRSWWSNILYINNLVDIKDAGCFGWAWYLANDMQFFIISPIFLLLLYWHWIPGFIAIFVTCLASFIVTGVLSVHYKISAGMMTGMMDGPPNGNDTDIMVGFNKLYVKPYCRIGPYLVGMAVGYVLYKTDCKPRLNWFVALLGWACAITLGMLTVYGLYDTFQGHPLSVEVSGLYNALFRTGWGLALGWVIFACSTGYGGFINTFLSWSAFVPLSRLTYVAYLIHPIVMIYVYGGLERLIFMDNITLSLVFVGFLGLCNALAFVVSMLVEAPMIGLERVILKRERSR